MTTGGQKFKRIIDLGCGDAPYFPANLPPSKQYIGVDSGEIGRREDVGVTLIHDDALAALTLLKPSSGDCIVSIFSGHHIGLPRLFHSLDRARQAGAEFLFIDPVMMNTSSCSAHWALSVASTGQALVSARLGRKRHALITFCLRAQLKFLLSRAGYRHVAEDFQDGLPRPAREIERLARAEFAEATPFVTQAGALLLIANGPRVLDWLVR